MGFHISMEKSEITFSYSENHGTNLRRRQEVEAVQRTSGEVEFEGMDIEHGLCVEMRVHEPLL